MKNLLHSSLVVASIVSAQPAHAAGTFESDRADRHLDALLYGEDVLTSRRPVREEGAEKIRRKAPKSGKVHRGSGKPGHEGSFSF